jgi:hypothetical protein
MSSPFLVVVFLVLLAALFRRPAAEALAERLPAEAYDLVETLGKPIPPVALAFLFGLGSWLCLAGLLVLMAKEPEPSCEGSLLDGCLGLPSWLTHFAWLLIAVPALSIAGAVLAVRSYTRGDDPGRALVALLVSITSGAVFGSLYAIAA